jgi:putative ABC transport system permease protein
VSPPPVWARALLKLLVPRARVDDVLGDLEETQGGMRDVLATAGAFAFYRARALWWAVARWMTLSDLRLGLRLIRKQPVLSATSVFALAAAIAVACMGYTFIEQMVSATLPFPHGDRFVRIEIDAPPNSEMPRDAELLQLLRAQATTMEHVAAIAIAPGELSLILDNGEVAGVRATIITPDTLRVLPYTPVLGRTFAAEDGAPHASPAILIRESLWRRHFSASPDIVGRTAHVGGVDRTVVGVMPDRFEFPFSAEAWLPFNATVDGARLIGVMRDGVATEQAQSEVQTVIARVTRTLDTNDPVRVRVVGFTTPNGDTDLLFPIVFGIILLTLLVVVGNVAVLITARGWSRATEIGVRTALGGGRARIVGQLTAEVSLLGVIASIAGVGVSIAALGGIDRAYPEIPFWIDLMPGPYTFVFVAGIALVTIAFAGVWPALVVTRRDPARALQHGGRGAPSGTFGRTAGIMITVQVAMAVALLSGAVSMARGFLAYVDGPAHIAEETLLTARINLPNTAALDDMTRRIVTAVAALPGVIGAGVGTHLPRRDPPMMPLEIDAAPDEALTTSIRAPGVGVASGFVEAIGGSARVGRLFTDADSAAGALPVIIVNESFVAEHFRGRNPLGRRIRAGAPRRNEPMVWREIVGVVPDLGISTADPTAGAGFYVPFTPRSEFMMVVRTSGSPLNLTQPLRTAIAAVDPAIRLREIVPLREVGADEQAFLAGMASTMIALGVGALALSVVSVYALLSFAVTRRTREIGVRVALGATSRQIVLSLLGSAGAYLVAGAVIGTALGVLLMQARSLIVFRMPTTGMWVLPAVIAPLLAAGLIACWVPARRALRIDPADALKTD